MEKIPTLAAGPNPISRAQRAGISSLETRELLDRVVMDDFKGASWMELERRLVVHAFTDLCRAIQTGSIYQRCANAGVPIASRRQLQIPPLNEYIAADAVAECQDCFKTRVLPEGQWDPGRGVRIEDFFVVCCLPHIANQWRWHQRRLPERVISIDGHPDLVMSDRFGSTGDTTEIRDLVEMALAEMSPEDQLAFRLLASGWSRNL